MPAKKRTKSYSQLPNAPLVEVVFELHWKLQEDASMPKQFWSDPGYPLLIEEFIPSASKHGFKKTKRMGVGSILTPHSVGLRFYKSENKPFPLLQIGPGIFASNESAAYDWGTFKRQTLDGVKILLSSYPKTKGLSLAPNYLELRYINSFDSSLSPQQNLITFLNEKSSFNIKLPPFLSKQPIGKSPKARLFFDFPVVKKKNTSFQVEIGSGTAKDKKTILLTSRVISTLDKANIGKTDKTQINYISKWLELAHSLTSPFFKDFVDKSLMAEFKKDTNASNASK